MISNALPLEVPMRWPGHSCGVRPPVFGETPLSAEEVAFAVRQGLLEVRRILSEPDVDAAAPVDGDARGQGL